MLTLAGRLTLANSVLSTILIYWMSIIRIPSIVVDKIDRMRCNSLWRGNSLCLGGHCLSWWDQICRPKQLGGLGVINTKLLNTCLLTKWWWRYFREENSPWMQLINKIYYVEMPPSSQNNNRIRLASSYLKSIAKVSR